MQMTTKEAIRTLQSKLNHAITVEDFDLIESLDVVARDLAGITKSERRLLDAPFFACGMRFYPLTIAKSLWYREKLVEFEIPELYHDAFMFWVLSIPNEEGAFDEFDTVAKVNRAMKRMARKLTCSADEMAEVFRKCAGLVEIESTDKESDEESDEESETAEATQYGGLIAVLLKEYGGTPTQWMIETPIETVAELFDQHMARYIAEQDAVRGDAAKGGKAIAPRNDQRIAGLARFRKKLNEIARAWGKDDG
jgi:hypothetical protein